MKLCLYWNFIELEHRFDYVIVQNHSGVMVQINHDILYKRTSMIADGHEMTANVHEMTMSVPAWKAGPSSSTSFTSKPCVLVRLPKLYTYHGISWHYILFYLHDHTRTSLASNNVHACVYFDMKKASHFGCFFFKQMLTL